MNKYTPLDFTKLKPANYSRKSSESEDKQMLSITSQLEEALRIADYYKLPKFVKVYQEAKSAKEEFARPHFMEMMKLIKVGAIDTIVCWKLDRLARNMAEGGMIIDLISSGIIKAIITHDKVYYPTDNVLLLAIEFGMGKQYVKDLSVNVKRGQTKKATMGLPHGVAALGFMNDKSEEKGNRKWLVDQDKFDTIAELFKMFLTGTYSAGKLHKYAVDVMKLRTVKRKRIGGQFITLSRIYEILKDPIYAGFFYYGGERYELDANLPRVITEAQHEKVKRLLSKKNIPKTQHHQTTYSGFITSDKGESIGQDVKFQVICDCKHKFAYRNKTHCPKCKKAIEDINNPKYLSYSWYYNVKKKKAGETYVHVSEKTVDEMVSVFFSENLSLSTEVVEWSKKYIHEMKVNEVNEKLLSTQQKEKRAIEFQDKKAKERAMLREGQITQEEYEDDISRLTKEYSDLDKKTEGVDWYSRLMQITDITERITSVFKSDNVQAKRNIISALGSNLIWNEEKLFIHNKKEINILIEGIKIHKSNYCKFEPKNALDKQGRFQGNDMHFSTLLRE